jgi:hypothetical protein
MFGNRTNETNTLALIGRWSMEGARGDLDGRFGSPLDIHAAVAGRHEEPSGEAPPPASAPLLMKPAGEDDWRPLFIGVSGV